MSFFCVKNPAFSANKRPIIDKLWFKLSKDDREILRQISFFLDAKKYDKALNAADDLYENSEIDKDKPNPFLVDRTKLTDGVKNIILWKKYSNYRAKDKISFNDISRFVEDNKFYPNIDELRKNAENIAAVNEIPYRFSEQYFLSNKAKSLESKLYLIEAKSEFLLGFKGSKRQKDKIADEIRDMIVEVFVEENFSKMQEREFLQEYGYNLTSEDYKNRINRLIWDSRFSDARRIFRFVEDDYRKLYVAIMKIRALPKYIRKHVMSVPRNLRNDENLTYARVLWHKSRGEIDDIVDLMLDIEELKYPDKWWGLRRLYSRELLKSKDYKLSYKLISNHHLTKKSKHFWEAEWMSGWISLRFLDRAAIAYAHFKTVYENVTQPVTLSRASYWCGMAALASGDEAKAKKWYKVAAKYPLYFYGQLAIHKRRLLDPIGAKNDVILPKDPDITIRDARNVAAMESAKVAYLLALMGDEKDATKVFEYLVWHAKTPGEIAVLMRIVNEVGDREMDVKISRKASKKNVFFIRDKFQIIDEVKDGDYAALVHAIIKQESGFAPSALSKVGAIGFMQIMPDTAREIARDLGVRYSKRKLATDIDYNIKLGSYYIKQLTDKFDGSHMLAIASYNAGPHNAQRWIDEFYDPRNQDDIDKVVDWVELITYAETRNYVQRITENLIVYKYLMTRNKDYKL